jgi:anti-anti-sigma regulatory factor
LPTVAATTNITYQRRKQGGALTLTGVVDIFEAESLHAAAARALKDLKTDALTIDLARLERLDVAALQILLALRSDFCATGRRISFCNTPAAVEATLAGVGILELTR